MFSSIRLCNSVNQFTKLITEKLIFSQIFLPCHSSIGGNLKHSYECKAAVICTRRRSFIHFCGIIAENVDLCICCRDSFNWISPASGCLEFNVLLYAVFPQKRAFIFMYNFKRFFVFEMFLWMYVGTQPGPDPKRFFNQVFVTLIQELKSVSKRCSCWTAQLALAVPSY